MPGHIKEFGAVVAIIFFTTRLMLSAVPQRTSLHEIRKAWNKFRTCSTNKHGISCEKRYGDDLSDFRPGGMKNGWMGFLIMKSENPLRM
ncbi:hypothetical protein BC829DRAFT_58624 [Chytridium lagenaria]|nr:hypothetical protein BC829DRAFT_58624 [Chytridium lagenaria]